MFPYKVVKLLIGWIGHESTIAKGIYIGMFSALCCFLRLIFLSVITFDPLINELLINPQSFLPLSLLTTVGVPKGRRHQGSVVAPHSERWR